MASPEQHRFCARVLASAAVAGVFLIALLAGEAAQAQQFKLLATFSGVNGNNPNGELTLDAAGNLYGTTFYGGVDNCSYGCGTVFKLSHHSSQWPLTSLYDFRGDSDGKYPWAGVSFGPDGALYGTTFGGGIGPCQGLGYSGCGTVFKLTPPATFCKAVSCPWTKTVLYTFTGDGDGANPQGHLVFDRAGNLYGTTSFGGRGSGNGNGVVYELSPSHGNWNISVLYAFSGGSDGGTPGDGVVVDGSGNLFGITDWGGAYSHGVVYELTNSASGWTETVLHDFAQGSEGYEPSGLVLDSNGNIYGATSQGGSLNAGTAYELQRSGSSFNYKIIYNFDPQITSAPAPVAAFTLDNAGNLYSTGIAGGTGGEGTVFELSPTGGSWNITVLHNFTDNFYFDGQEPACKPIFDSQGNLYGTTEYGGRGRDGVVWEITP
jgi:uncharacterized repeat protein (TIGR03803 family)